MISYYKAPASRLWPSLKAGYASRPLLVGAMVISGGFFFRSGSPFEQHPLALNGVRELYLVFCCLLAGLALIDGFRKGHLFTGDVILLFIGVAFPIASAILANLKFDQPFLIGVFEERRTFAILGFFLIMFAYRRSNATPDELLGALYCTALIYVVIALLMQFGVLADLASRDIPSLDPRKHRILVGTETYALSIVVAASMAIRYRAWPHMVPILVGLVGLVFISQTRGAMLIMAVTIIVLIALARLSVILPVAIIAASAGLVFYAAEPARFQGSEISEVQIRINTAQTIVDEVRANDGIGLGSLSLQWNDGFAPLYGRHFFLSDVGILGEVYRLGLLLPIIYLLLGVAVFFYINSCKSQKGRIVCYGIVVFAILNSVGGGIIAFAGLQWAILSAVATAFRHDFKL